MRTIRASEIGSYLYCQRAWWYQKQGYETENLPEMAAGSEMHYRHGQAVLASGCVKTLALALLLLAIVFLAIFLVQTFL